MSVQKWTRFPPLILQANRDNLCLLVVVRDNAMHAIEVGNKNYVHCVTNKDVPIPNGCMMREVELKGLFFSLIESGLNGMFSTSTNIVGFEWKDLFRSATPQQSSTSSSETTSSKVLKAPSKQSGRKARIQYKHKKK